MEIYKIVLVSCLLVSVLDSEKITAFFFCCPHDRREWGSQSMAANVSTTLVTASWHSEC